MHGIKDRVQTVEGLEMNQVGVTNTYLSEALESVEAKGDIVDARVPHEYIFVFKISGNNRIRIQNN